MEKHEKAELNELENMLFLTPLLAQRMRLLRELARVADLPLCGAQDRSDDIREELAKLAKLH